MTFVLKDHPKCFSDQLTSIVEKFPKSKNSIEKIISHIKDRPFQESRIPGFNQLHLRKVRLPLQEYKISKRNGLRLVYLVEANEHWVLMVAICYKKECNSGWAIQAIIKKNLKSILTSLDQNTLPN